MEDRIEDRVAGCKGRLEGAFRHIAETRMRDIPILNHALRVEAVGCRDWQGQFVGVLVTPWFMSLILMPLDEITPFYPAALMLETVRVTLPGGVFPALMGEEPGVGRYLASSFFSPVLEFADHETAALTAEAILIEIMAVAATEDDTFHEAENWNKIMNPGAEPVPAEAPEDVKDVSADVDAVLAADRPADPARRSLLGIRKAPLAGADR